MKWSLLILILIAVTLTACAYPTTRVDVIDDRPKIYISGAPNTASLFVDAVNMGNASLYNGNPKVLIVEPGRHKIEIILGDRILFSRDVYIGRDTVKKISVGSI